MTQAHAPSGQADLAPTSLARTRLAYDELLAHQITLALARASERKVPGQVTKGTGVLQAKVRAGLPYAATGAQDRAIEQIAADMAAPARMNRLLQGDVGSGKTIVALLTLLVAGRSGIGPVEQVRTGLLDALRDHPDRWDLSSASSTGPAPRGRWRASSARQTAGWR